MEWSVPPFSGIVHYVLLVNVLFFKFFHFSVKLFLNFLSETVNLKLGYVFEYVLKLTRY